MQDGLFIDICMLRCEVCGKYASVINEDKIFYFNHSILVVITIQKKIAQRKLFFCLKKKKNHVPLHFVGIFKYILFVLK